MNVTFSITDVRKRADLTDYTGQLLADMVVRVTDTDNEVAPGRRLRSRDRERLLVPDHVPCAATASGTVGGTCGLATTLRRGHCRERSRNGDRSIWQLGRCRCSTAAADGQVSTSPNTLFARQGVFVP